MKRAIALTCGSSVPKSVTVVTAFAYGVVLCFVAVMVTGVGHGTYTLLTLAGAPSSALGPFFAVISTIFQWPIVANELYRRRTRVLAAFLVVHYVIALALLLLPFSPYSDWEYVANLPAPYQRFLYFGFAWYGVGQVCLWWMILKRNSTRFRAE